MTNSRRVYSTESGRICPGCDRPVSACACKQSDPPFGDGVVRIRRELKGRRGKTVTSVTGLPYNPGDLKDYASSLKRRLGTGGSVKEGCLIIQGDHRAALKKIFEEEGLRVKLAGG